MRIIHYHSPSGKFRRRSQSDPVARAAAAGLLSRRTTPCCSASARSSAMTSCPRKPRANKRVFVLGSGAGHRAAAPAVAARQLVGAGGARAVDRQADRPAGNRRDRQRGAAGDDAAAACRGLPAPTKGEVVFLPHY